VLVIVEMVAVLLLEVHCDGNGDGGFDSVVVVVFFMVYSSFSVSLQSIVLNTLFSDWLICWINESHNS